MSNDFLAEVAATSNPEIKVIHLTGDLDEISIESLQQTVDPIMADSSIKRIIFDFSGLRFINSKGIGFLVAIHTHLSKDGRVLMLVGASEAVMDVITLVGLTTIIPYHNTVDEAVASSFVAH